MLIGLGTLILLSLIFGPQLWTQHIFKRYKVQIDEIPGTGGELARHLLDKLNMEEIQVEITEAGNDHYDPLEKIVRLSPDIHDGKSLTAIVVAAHEVGHAIQDHSAYKPLQLRGQLAKYVAYSEKFASILLVAFPFMMVLTHMPLVGGLMLASGVIMLLLPVAFHLVTLPVEIDASFRRALPILIQGEYIPQSAIPIAHRILTAAALTYLSASLASLLNFYRWIVFLRR
ncbi:MAG: zinc metallopeptidase [Gammaproteobacteria bacterium]|nr:zinc metallopeptidase [Gammaproteobacteria bacterium]